MGSGVKEISFYAFNRSEFQGTLKIGENVTTIEKGAFKQCNLIIPDNVELIKEEAFHSTNFTGNLQIGNGIEDIPEKAFQNCNTQGTLTIGNGVRTIGNYAFYGSNFQGSFTMGKNVTSIGTSAFENCGCTQELIISENVTQSAYVLLPIVNSHQKSLLLVCNPVHNSLFQIK